MLLGLSLLALGFATLFVIFVGFLLFFSLLPMIRGAFYAGTSEETLGKMLLLARIQPGQRVADIGSGDGRIVIASAKAGATAYGYEINPLLVWWSRRKIRKEGLQGKAFVYWKNFWNQPFNSFDVVFVYGIGSMMKELEEKLQKELKPDARVISNSFSFSNWPCTKILGPARLYVKTRDVQRKKKAG